MIDREKTENIETHILNGNKIFSHLLNFWKSKAIWFKLKIYYRF